jgi:hypothetical protein
MKSLRSIARNVPVLPALVRRWRAAAAARRLRRQSAEEVFSAIYRKNAWGGAESVSGPGSDAVQTRTVAAALTALCRELGVTTLLDIPCGDFHWMREVDLAGIDYTGADIVGELIARNTGSYGCAGRHFRKLNLLEDPLPKADLVFCRDCLVHFSYRDVGRALDTIRASGSTYLVTTTFPARNSNRDIATGEWRPLNLEAAPLLLPRPLRLIDEGCTEGDGQYRDKSLGLWRIADIRTQP